MSPLASCLLAGTLCAASLARAELPATVRERLDAAGLPSEAMAFVVQRVSDGAVVMEHRSGRPMQPASTIKLLTSLAALEVLGPAHQARTELRSDGELEDGVLKGDLVLHGEGDVDFDWPAFEHALHILRLQGIREVRGDFVIDRTYFEPARTDVGRAPFDEAPEFRYNVVPDAALINSNLVKLDILSDDKGVRIEATPALERVSYAADFELVEARCNDWEDGWVAPAVKEGSDGVIRVRLQGRFPRSCLASTEISVIERLKFADRLFRAAWKRLGGTYRGRTREGRGPEGARVLTEHRSRPLAEVLRDINKHSDNPNTRITYLALGASSRSTEGTTAQRSERELRSWLAAKSIDSDGLVLENGSGLSRAERIRPAQLAAVLKAGLESPWAPEFLASIPIVSVDGGMGRRLIDTPASQRSRIKTGTLRDVSAVAGYVKDDAGETYIVVAMVNHERAVKQVARPILDTLLEWVADVRARASTRP